MQPEEIAFATWIGAVLLALCGLPQAIKAYRRPESTRGLSWWFLGSWLAGEFAFLYGFLGFVSFHAIANYVINILIICVLMGYKFSLPPGAER